VTTHRTKLVGGLLGAALAAGAVRAQAPKHEFAADRPTDFAVLPATAVVPAYTLDDLTRLGLARHPRLADAALAAEAARGLALQAGLYPNPVLSFYGDELNDRTARSGILTLPELKQEIVTGGKLTLSRAVAEREANQATLAVLGRRAELLAGIRAAYFDAVALDRRVAILRELRTLTRQSVEQAEKRVQAKQATRLDVVQLEVEAEKARAEADAAEQEVAAAFHRLAAAVGARDLPPAPLANAFDAPLPPYDLDRLQAHVLAVHPDLRSARVGVERAQLALERARAEVIPNVTVSGAFVRQHQNKSSDFSVGVSVPLPTWDRNQGNVQAAQARVAQAVRAVEQAENELSDRVAAAYRDFAAARTKADRLEGVRAKAEEAHRLIAENEVNFTAAQRLIAQYAVAQARLEAAKARADAWKAASAISGLTLEDTWPPRPPESEGKW
jgi:outer membrane protein, heavy metal efflux system